VKRTRAPFSGTAVVYAAAAAAINRRHEHSATAAESFRSERHRSDGGTRVWPKVPPAVGRLASRQVGTREYGVDETEKVERAKKKGKDKGREEENSRGSDELTRATVPGVCASSRPLWSSRRRAIGVNFSNMEKRPIAAHVIVDTVFFSLLNYIIFNFHKI